ncbi:SnoaL-like protein [Novosphingobium sp. PhB165]|uniref:nuclear transport factor 2 family protein n=1 Tax=Novosphingobium sp. PhB165 TaxID=2485105 RepID=UPI0010D8044B|nr:nuclear transport factor 2 family protein [Novosphingobium sp. PhB165]TCM16550.1 SnoaL-like protein [Novosphingobium sp. PhB165]
MNQPAVSRAELPMSSARMKELLERNLREVFGENDPDRRRAALNELWTEDCTLHVPPGVIRGREAIDAFAGQLRIAHPDFVYTPLGEPQILHDAGRLAWGSGPVGEPPRYTGWDVVIASNGRIATLIVFLDGNGE